jgi:dUTP pyrophosphatase
MELTADMHIVLMPGAVIPRYGTGGAACFDIAATEMVNIPPGKTATVSTGLKVAVPKGFELQIRPRSGLSSRGILVQFGTVDEDYRGEIKVIV